MSGRRFISLHLPIQNKHHPWGDNKKALSIYREGFFYNKVIISMLTFLFLLGFLKIYIAQS